MQRWLSILLGAGVLALAVVLAFFSTPKHRAVAPAPSASAEEASSAAITSAASIDAGALDLAAVALADPVADRATGSGPGYKMMDGSPVPPVPQHSPREVQFGVVLVTYAGAENAPKNARSKADALALAQKLDVDAKSDFRGAVQRGDNGSADNLGSMGRGVLEPAPEYALFSLPPGGVSDVVDTPRGFWIVRRIE